MEVTARTAIALLLALVVASSFLSDGVHGGKSRHHHTKHTKHNSAPPPSHAPGPASSRRAPAPARASPPAPPASAPSSPRRVPAPARASPPAPPASAPSSPRRAPAPARASPLAPPASAPSNPRRVPAPARASPPAPPASAPSTPRRAPAPARASPPAPPASAPSTYPMPSAPAPAPAAGARAVYDIVKDFGAVGDGVTDDTDALKTAWDTACSDDGPGVIVAAAGHSFLVHTTVFTGPCQGSVTLQVDGTIVAPSDPETWPANSKRNWLVFYRADGVSLRGTGLIDGKGQKWWDLPCKPHKGTHGGNTHGSCDSPVALRFFESNNVTVQGLKVQNSPEFHFRFDSCRGVLVSGLAISSPALSPNTDGIHVENTQDVLITNSVVSNGDDCVSIGAGTLNVHIENVTCGPGHGISIGSLGKQGTRACVANVTVRNAVIRHSDNGVRIKTWQGGSGSVSAVTFDNVRMDDVRNPIIIDQFYCLSKSCENETTAVFVSGVSYTGIRGTYDPRGPPIHFGCSDAVPCTNITLSDVELLPASGDTVDDPFCWNVYGSAATPTVPPVACLLEGVPRNVDENSSLKCY